MIVIFWILNLGLLAAITVALVGALIARHASNKNKNSPLTMTQRLIVGPVPSSSVLENATREIIRKGRNELSSLPNPSEESIGMINIYEELESLASSRDSIGRKELETEWFAKRKAFEDLRSRFLRGQN